jgi:hypothetical protein
MNAIDELVCKTNEVFTNPITVLPAIKAEVADRIKTYRDAGLVKQASQQEYLARCEQAQALGFIKITMPEIVNILRPEYRGGSPYEISGQDRGHRSRLEYFLARNGLSCSDDVYWNFADWHPGGTWFQWDALRVRTGPLDSLKMPIPYGVVLRVQELKALKLFNLFSVHAPIELFRNSEVRRDNDPVVTASICDPEHKETLFFVAKW